MKVRLILRTYCLCLFLAVMLVWAGNNIVKANNVTGMCSDKEAGGILLYAPEPCTWTFSIINMTGKNLTIVGVPNHSLFSVNTVVNAYRSMKYQYHVDAGAKRWQGNLAIKPGAGGSIYQFNVAFQTSTGLNGMYPSTWIYLPVPSSGPYLKIRSSSTGQIVYGRWSTNVPVGGDHKMHNIMTIVSDKVIASLCSVDNKHVTLVISDTLRNYTGMALDWAWNNGPSVPGTCGLCDRSDPHSVNCSQ